MSRGIDETGYNDGNRAFLQAFMARSCMTFDEAQPVLAAIFSVQEGYNVPSVNVTREDLDSYIDVTNAAISPFDFEIRSTLRQTAHRHGGSDQQRPERVFALVNTTSDPLMQLATTYSADEIAFVKRVLDAMFDTYNTRRLEAMVITAMQAVQLAKASTGDSGRTQSSTQQQTQSQGGAVQSLSMSQAESVMKRLVEEGWFEVSQKGFYSLSPRALMELRGWLVATYNEDDDGDGTNKIKFCAACSDIITVGQRCGNRDCTGRLHDMCIHNFFRMQQAEKCPVCKADWPGDKFVGERAITATERYIRDKRRSTNLRHQGDARTSPSVGTNENDVEED